MPKRSEIRAELGKQQFTDAQLRGAIARLNLPTEDGCDYSEEQSKQIKEALLQVGKPQQPQSEQQSAQVPFDRDAAKSLVKQLQTESHQDSQSMVVQAVDSLNRAEAARSRMLDMLSDRKAYLTDPVMFWAELEQLTRQKRMKPATEQQSVEAEVVELADSFSTALDTWKYPQIAPTSSMGALPAY